MICGSSQDASVGGSGQAKSFVGEVMQAADEQVTQAVASGRADQLAAAHALAGAGQRHLPARCVRPRGAW